MKIGEVAPEEIFARFEPAVDVESVVADIIADVRANGDKALYAYAKKFDRAELKSLQVSADELEEAFDSVEPEFLDVLKEAAETLGETRLAKRIRMQVGVEERKLTRAKDAFTASLS